MMGASNFPTDPASIKLSHLLDTSVAIVLRDDHIAAKTFLSELGARPSLSVVTRVELEGGVYARPEMALQRRRRLDALLRKFEVIDFSAEMASIYGGIVERSGFNRRKIIDRMIAATALARDLTLITANAADFTEIDQLKLEIWPVE